MNVSRGLFRAWIVTSILWIIGAGTLAYINIAPTVRGTFSPIVTVKKSAAASTTNETISKIIDGSSGQFYDIVVSPANERSRVEFSLLEKPTTDTNNLIVFPDGSQLYVVRGYNEIDRNYIKEQFWDQRWGRWGYAAGIVALWAFIPCIVLLALGYAFLWVGRGFYRA